MPSDAQFEIELKECFLEEARTMLEDAERPLLDGALDTLARLLHNLKGGAQSVGLDPFAAVAHAWETLLSEVKKAGAGLSAVDRKKFFACRDGLLRLIETYRKDLAAVPDVSDLLAILAGGTVAEDMSPLASAETVRIPRASIDRLVDNLGELGVLHTALRDALVDPSALRAFEHTDKLLRDTQEVAFGLTMVPIAPLFQKMRRVVEEVSGQLGKAVELELRGQDTGIETNILEALGDPLMHLVRNAVDHGIEPASVRAQNGKPAVGHLVLTAYHRGDRVGIEIRDDGAGLVPEKLIARARAKKLVPAEVELSTAEAYALIFLPGFSTAETVSEISGRGVGMDVVKENISSLGGRIEIESEPGRGACFRLLLPFHLALLDGLLVRSAEETYVVPLSLLEEVLECEESEATFLNYRGEEIPLFALGDLLGVPSAEATSLLILKDPKGRHYGLRVRDVLARKEIVMKRPGNELRKDWISGYTILGDGKVALVLDVRALAVAA